MDTDHLTSLPPNASLRADTMSPSSPAPSLKDDPSPQVNDVHTYKLYRKRFSGLLGIVCHSLWDTVRRIIDGLA
jgi:hypothetical protein